MSSTSVLPLVFDLCRRFGTDAAFPGKAAAFLHRLAVRFSGAAVNEAGTLAEFQEQTGLHPAFLDDRIELTRSMIVTRLQAGLVGQEPAVTAFADVLVKLKARLHDPRRPLGVFLLLGPTGVGKTQAARALATFLFGHADRLLRFDLNEFTDGASAQRLTGTTQAPDGLLTGAIRRQPFSVVLLDEVEKATPEVFDLLLAVLDEGRLTDATGRVADFTQTIIVLTSNLGAREARAQLGFRPGAATDQAVYLDAAGKFFRPEFFNRIDHVLPFRELSPVELEGIARRLIQNVFSRDGLRRRECQLHVTPAAVSRLVELGHHPQLGARALKRAIEREVAQPLAVRLAALASQLPVLASLDFPGPKLVLQLDELRPVARSVTWGERIAARGDAGVGREWLANLVAAAGEFLERTGATLAAVAPAGPLELGNMPPAHARYFFGREQWRKVERLVTAVEQSLRGAARGPGIAHRPRPKPRRLMVRQLRSGTLDCDSAREAASLQAELTDLDTTNAVELPDVPAVALLREAALLNSLMATPADDRPLALFVQALDNLDEPEAGQLTLVFESALAGVWGSTCERLKPAAKCPATGTRGLWCRGLNLRLLLPAAGHRVLVRRRNGTMGILFVSVHDAADEAAARSLLGERCIAAPAARGTEPAPLNLLVHAGCTITDFRSGVVIPVTPSRDEARIGLLSTLPLPPGLNC